MSTVDVLRAQYGSKVVVPIDVVCRDHFAPLTVPTLVRKILAGEIELPLIRIERSRYSAKGVRIQDLANYIDTRAANGPDRVRAALRRTRNDDAAQMVKSKSAGYRSATLPFSCPEREDVVEPAMEMALTLTLAAERWV